MRAHTKAVSGITFFNDLRHAITCSWDGTLRIWDVQKGTLVGELLDAHKGEVFSVAISPNDKRIASSGNDATVIIWDTESKRKLFDPLVEHTHGVYSICFSPDGKKLASGSEDHSVVVWDAETGATLMTLHGSDTVWSVAFSPDGLKLAIGSLFLQIRRSDNADLLFEINAHQYWVRSIVWSPDSLQLISASYDKTVKFWNASTGHQIGEPCTGHAARIRSLAISLDGSFIATGSDDNTVRLWSTETHQQIGQPVEHPSQAYCVAICPNGAQLASGHYNQDVCLWSIGNSRTTDNQLRHLQKQGRRNLSEVSDVQTEPDVGVLLRDLTPYITKVEDYPIARGGFGEIWECIFSTYQGPIKVAVKSLLTYTSDKLREVVEKKTKRIQRELRTCARLKHPNILAVYGYTYGFGRFMAIVSPWAENGNLTAYLEQEDATLVLAERFKILRDIATGLQYLHTNNVIHGDLNGPNVLIHGDGTACLADFGLSLMYSEVMSISAASWTSAFHGNTRWLAPELLGDPEDELPVRPTAHSDIYSFGGIVLHVLTGKTPYYYLSEAAVIQRIGTGIKPLRSRYRAVSDKHWRFINICWSDAETRPSAEEAVEWIGDELDLLSNPGTVT